MREVSKAAFGQELRLALCLFIANNDDEYFTLGAAASALGVTPSALQGPLTSLIAIGVVRRLSTPPRSRERWLGRQPSAIWAFAAELGSDDDWSQLLLEF